MARRAATARNAAAAGVGEPGRCTITRSRISGGSKGTVTAPCAAASTAIASGITAAPAPASTSGRIASRWLVSIATRGRSPSRPRAASSSLRPELPGGVTISGTSARLPGRSGPAGAAEPGGNTATSCCLRNGTVTRPSAARLASVTPTSAAPVRTCSASSSGSPGEAMCTVTAG